MTKGILDKNEKLYPVVGCCVSCNWRGNRHGYHSYNEGEIEKFPTDDQIAEACKGVKERLQKEHDETGHCTEEIILS